MLLKTIYQGEIKNMFIDFTFSSIEYLTIESGSVMAEILIYTCLLSFLILAILKAIKGFKNVN